jgi:TonB family protein
VALALWLIAMNPPQLPRSEEPIAVTIEQPPPKPEPPKPPQTAPVETPKAPLTLGLPPPAEIEADKPSQKASTAAKAQESMAPEPPKLEQAVPPPPPPDTAFALPKPDPSETKPAPQLPPPPFRPSPLHTGPRQQPPALASKEEPSTSPFVNPAETYSRARVSDNYLWQVIARLSGYHYYSDVDVREGTTVVQIVIARDGRLLNVTVARSSGYPQLDQGVVTGIRSGSPYAPLPPSIKGDSATFTLPLVSVIHR